MTQTPSVQSGEATLIHLANALLRWRFLILIPSVLLAGVVVVVGLLMPRTYTASASFAPQAALGGGSQVRGLAAQFGIAVPSTDASTSPEFYADLLRSAQLLRALADSTYTFADGPDTIRAGLVEVYGVRRATPARSVEKAVERLRDDLRVSTDIKTGVVTVAVRASAAELAFQLTRYSLDLLNRFNLRSRQSQAAAERAFVEARAMEAREDLRNSENRLEEFLTANRMFANAPQLQFQYDRLQRDVQLRQAVYTQLIQGYEDARIAEIRNTPVITIVEEPVVPVRPDSRHLALLGIAALLLGGLSGVFLVAYRQALSRTRAVFPAEYGEFERLLGEFAADVHWPWRGRA